MPENAASASSSFFSGLSIIINFQGCELQAEGARRAASTHLSIISLSIFFGR